MNGIKKQFKVAGQNIPILNIPHWSVTKGEKVALIGPSGSGKSTLLHLISGILSVDEGELIVDHQPLHLLKESARDEFRGRRMGYILQDFHLIPSLSARQNVEIIMSVKKSKKESHALLDDWFEKVGLQDRMNHLPSQLSRGQQQRVAMVRALINEPLLVLADEPTGSLDWETADEITALLMDLCASDKHTLIVVTHDLNMANRFPRCQHIHELNVVHSPMRKNEDPLYMIDDQTECDSGSTIYQIKEEVTQ
ncbi:ABC transporter ATP-binding protein [Paenibacillus sp. FA6]|uniref:ABC transporter ATP-binding protein n=1 Tax=Paenibacillus sp. FA6 TaxID=3413029 RepID=UPI003F658A5E